MKKTFLLLILLILLLGVASSIKNQRQNQSNKTPVSTSVTHRSVVENYIRQNISKLSPEKEVLGGTFYVTYIEVNDGFGVVAYEDGHIALTADFTYIIDSSGLPNITSFKLRTQ